MNFNFWFNFCYVAFLSFQYYAYWFVHFPGHVVPAGEEPRWAHCHVWAARRDSSQVRPVVVHATEPATVSQAPVPLAVAPSRRPWTQVRPSHSRREGASCTSGKEYRRFLKLWLLNRVISRNKLLIGRWQSLWLSSTRWNHILRGISWWPPCVHLHQTQDVWVQPNPTQLASEKYFNG